MLRAKGNTALLMFYNLENLFYPLNSQNIDNQLRNWSLSRYQKKLKSISETLLLIQKTYGSLPIIIGVCEVQGIQPLEDLIQYPPLSSYGIIHYKGCDKRGVDTALLYDSKEIEVLHSEPLPISETRSIIFAKIQYCNSIFNVYTLHLPSRRGSDEAKNKREIILNTLKEHLINNLNAQKEPVIILGDFNANPNDEAIRNLMNINPRFQLINPFSEVYANRSFSNFHRSKGLLFDQILFSEHLVSENFSLAFVKAEIFAPEQLKQHGKPSRTFAGSRYLGGQSDHFPVIIQTKTIIN